MGYRADSRFVLNQWEMVFLCNDVSHWLGASLESALGYVVGVFVGFSYIYSSNSLFCAGTIWHDVAWSTLVPLMTCCLIEPIHYLNQYWHIVNISLNCISKLPISNDITIPRGQWVQPGLEQSVPHSILSVDLNIIRETIIHQMCQKHAAKMISAAESSWNFNVKPLPL